jgi:ketosteroid isomerase-like protein
MAPASAREKDVAAIEAVLKLYADLTNARDAVAVSTQVYRAPILLLTPDGDHVAFEDSGALAAGFRDYLDGETKAGRTSTAIERMHVRLLSDSVALAEADYSYAGPAGASKDGWIYTFQKNAGEWRAVSAAPRDIKG